MSRIWLIPSALVVLLMGLGPLGAWAGWLEPMLGFRLFLVGFLVAAISAVVLGGAAAVGSALGKAWRRPALLGAIVPLAATAFIVSQIQTEIPTIHDITTDLQDPPAWTAGPAAGAEHVPEVGEIQATAYPDVQPLELRVAPDVAFRHALETANAMPGWRVTGSDAARGTIEATDTSRIFRFVDDVVIRVRPSDAGARVDLRSRSRQGQSDLGANAARILAYGERLNAVAAGAD